MATQKLINAARPESRRLFEDHRIEVGSLVLTISAGTEVSDLMTNANMFLQEAIDATESLAGAGIQPIEVRPNALNALRRVLELSLGIVDAVDEERIASERSAS